MPPGTRRRALRWGIGLLGALEKPSSRSLVPSHSPNPGDQTRCHRIGHQTHSQDRKGICIKSPYGIIFHSASIIIVICLDFPPPCFMLPNPELQRHSPSAWAPLPHPPPANRTNPPFRQQQTEIQRDGGAEQQLPGWADPAPLLLQGTNHHQHHSSATLQARNVWPSSSQNPGSAHPGLPAASGT